MTRYYSRLKEAEGISFFDSDTTQFLEALLPFFRSVSRGGSASLGWSNQYDLWDVRKGYLFDPSPSSYEMNISLDLRVFKAKRYFCRGEAKTTTTIRHAYYSSSYSEFLMVTSPTHFPERVLLIYGRSLPKSVCMV